jgi:hypothetical protein
VGIFLKNKSKRMKIPVILIALMNFKKTALIFTVSVRSHKRAHLVLNKVIEVFLITAVSNSGSLSPRRKSR